MEGKSIRVYRIIFVEIFVSKQHFVPRAGRTKSNQIEFVQLVAAQKFYSEGIAVFTKIHRFEQAVTFLANLSPDLYTRGDL